LEDKRTDEMKICQAIRPPCASIGGWWAGHTKFLHSVGLTFCVAHLVEKELKCRNECPLSGTSSLQGSERLLPWVLPVGLTLPGSGELPGSAFVGPWCHPSHLPWLDRRSCAPICTPGPWCSPEMVCSPSVPALGSRPPGPSWPGPGPGPPFFHSGSLAILGAPVPQAQPTAPR